MIGRALRRTFALLRLLLVSPFLLIGWLFEPRRRDVVRLELRGGVPEEPSGSGSRLLRRFLAVPRTSLVEALHAIAALEEDPKPKALLVELDHAGLSLAHAQELAARLRLLRERGRKVYAWLDEADAGALVVAAAADRAWAAPGGQLAFTGIRLRALFLRDPLDKVGVVPEMLPIGPWKTAADMFTHREATPENKEQLESLADGLWRELADEVEKGRRLAPGDFARAIDQAPVSHAAAVERRLFDGELRRDELAKKLTTELGSEPADELAFVDHSAPLSRSSRRERVRSAFRDRPTVAIVPLRGMIVSGDEAPPRGGATPSRPLVDLLEALRDDRSVDAVVLRIDSPGGSATASEELWHAVRRLDETRPVVASLGRVAASGGYYAACAARRIVCGESTITGSIGVITGKLHVGPLLERAGVGLAVAERGARAGIFSPERGFTPEERDAVRREMERFYELFLSRVATGRKRTRDEVDAVGRGRVFTGRAALERRLVDELGGLRRAVEVAAELAKLQGKPAVGFLHPRPRRSSPLAMFAGAALPPGLEALAAAGELLSRERVLALELLHVEGI